MNKLLSIFLLLAVLSSCKTDKTPEATLESESTNTDSYTITPFEPSTEFADAKIEGVTYENGKFSFQLAEGSYELGVQTPDADAKMCANSAKGQHIHLIVNNEPYAAKYTADFDYKIEDGTHHVLAFLSRSYHESIKTDDAHVLMKAEVTDSTLVTENPVTDPMVFYSRPKGTYVGADTEKIMLDFYLANCDLGDDHKIMAKINDQEELLDTWQPYYIEGLPMGENTITLTLIDADGNVIETPLNPVSRTFTLVEDPAPEK